MTSPLPLAQLSRGELEVLRHIVAKRRLPMPLTEAGLASLGKSGLYERLGVLESASEAVALALIDLALAARAAPVAAVSSRAPAVLTWTEPTAASAHVRATTPVLLELLGLARKRVIIAGYEFDHGAILFKPLYEVMKSHGVEVSIYLDIRPAPSPRSNMAAYLATCAHQFMSENWPHGEPTPQLYYYPAGCAYGSHRSLHAKCVVVDDTHVLVGSANFTRRGHARNLEVGVRLEDPMLAAALTQQLAHLVEHGELVPLALARSGDSADDLSLGVVPDDAAAKLASELTVGEGTRTLFARLLVGGVAVPRVSAAVVDDAGQLVGRPALSWEQARVVVLAPEQAELRGPLEALGWACFDTLMGDEALLAELSVRVRGGG